MKTNAKQRAEFGTAGEVTNYTPDEFTRELIADVEAAVPLLQFAKDAMTRLVPPDWAEGLDAGQVASINDSLRELATFLKEPKS